MSQSTWMHRCGLRAKPPPDACHPIDMRYARKPQDVLGRSAGSGCIESKPVEPCRPPKYLGPLRRPAVQSRQFLLGEIRMHDATTAVKPRRFFGAFVVHLLLLSSFFGFLGAKPAQAQATFSITPRIPLLPNNDPFLRTSQVPEDTKTASEEMNSVSYDITLTNAVANTTYSVTVQTANGTEFLSPNDFLLNDNAPDAGRTAIGDSNNTFLFDPRYNTPPTTAPNNFPPYFYPNDYLITPLNANGDPQATLTFTGNGTQTVTVRVIDDKDYEAIQPNDPVTFSQSFIVRLAGESARLDNNPAPITINPNRNDSRHFIIDNDPRPDIAVAPVVVDPFDDPFNNIPTINAFFEQNSGINRNGVTVFLSARNEVNDINFNYSFSSGTGQTPATEGTDFNNT
ncbi:MAG: hypothetical protein JWN98_156, partial [Abditibacteriota bacterium]|nr:hypothetical protein [Abditibacteriota bacterium]